MFQQSQDDRSSLEAAAEAAAKVNAMLIAKGMLKPNQIHGGPNVITKKVGGPNSLVVAEVEINNLTTPCRNTLTRGTTQEEISKASGAAVTTRGRYMAPDDRVRNPRDRCLYLNVQASTRESVDIAVQKINEIIRSMCGNKLEPRGRGGNHHRGRGMRHPYRPPAAQNRNNIRNQPPPPLMSLPTPPPPVIPLHTQPPPFQTVTVLQEKLYVGLEHAPPNFDTKNKLLGPEGSYLQHIQMETGAGVSLRGKGSGFPDMTGADSIEPMHIHIEQQSLEALQEAKKLAENLIQTVQQSYVSFQQALAALPPSMPTGLITGVRQQPPYLEQQFMPTAMAPVPEQLQALQPQMQPLGPPQVMLPASSIANQMPPLQAIQSAAPGPPMVIPSSLTLTQMPLVNTLPASAPSMLAPHPTNAIEHQQQQLILSQPPQHGPPPPQLVQQPQALPAAGAPPPPQQLPPPLQPGGVYTSVQPTLQLVSQPVMSVVQPGQPPQMAGPPPPIAQHQPQPQPHQIPLQVQSLMGPPPAPHHPYSAATSVVYTVASSTAMPFYSSPKLEEIPKRRFTEEKDDNISENLLGYQHGPPHLVNLVQSSPPPHSQAAAQPPPAPHVHPQPHHVIQLGLPPPQDPGPPQLQHLAGHPAILPQPPHQQQQIHLHPQGPPPQFQPVPGQQPQQLPPHHQLVPTPHLMVPPPMAGLPHSPTVQQMAQPIEIRLPSCSSALMPPPPPPSPLSSQGAMKEEEMRAVMPPPKSPEVPWESRPKVSSPSPFEPDKKKIRGILKNKNNSSNANKETAESTNEAGNGQVMEENGGIIKDNGEDKTHPVSPQYQGQPLRYPSMPSDPNLPPNVTQEHQPLPPEGALLPPGHPSHQLRALHPGHLVHHPDSGPIHLAPHHPPIQIEGPRPEGPAPGTQIVIEHPGLPPPPGMHLAQHPQHRLELAAPHPAQRHVIIEQHPVPQPEHLAPHLAHQPPHPSQELFELEMQQQQQQPPPPQFHHIEHISVSQPNPTGPEQMLPPQASAMIVSSGQPFQQYSVAISSAATVVPPPPPPPQSYALTTSGVGAMPFSFPNPPQHIVGGPPPPPPPPASSYSLGGPPPPISSYSFGGPPPLPPTSSPQFQQHFATMQLQPQPGHVYPQAQQPPQQQQVPVASSQYQAAPQAQPAISYWLSQAQ